MKTWSKICTVLGCVLLFACILVFGLLESRKSQGPSVSQDSVQDSFTRYVFTDQREDGSSVSANVYVHDDRLYLMQAYRDFGGQWAYRHVKFNDDQIQAWYDMIENSISKKSDGEPVVSNKQCFGELFYSSDKGTMSYNVEPFDLSDYGYEDPWQAKQATIGDLPEYCEIFDVPAMRSLLSFEGNARENAYLASLHEQMADIVFAGESGASELAKYSFESIQIDSVQESDYVLKLKSRDGDYSFLVTLEGYVLGHD